MLPLITNRPKPKRRRQHLTEHPPHHPSKTKRRQVPNTSTRSTGLQPRLPRPSSLYPTKQPSTLILRRSPTRPPLRLLLQQLKLKLTIPKRLVSTIPSAGSPYRTTTQRKSSRYLVILLSSSNTNSLLTKMITTRNHNLSVLTQLNKRNIKLTTRPTTLFVNMTSLTLQGKLTIRFRRDTRIMILYFLRNRHFKRFLHPMNTSTFHLQLSTRRNRANNIRITKFRHRYANRVITKLNQLLVRMSTTRNAVQRRFSSRFRQRLRTNKGILSNKRVRLRRVRRQGSLINRPRRCTRIITIGRLLSMNMRIRFFLLVQHDKRLTQRQSRLRRNTSLIQRSRHRVTLYLTLNTSSRTSVLNINKFNRSTRNRQQAVGRLAQHNRTSKGSVVTFLSVYAFYNKRRVPHQHYGHQNGNRTRHRGSNRRRQSRPFNLRETSLLFTFRELQSYNKGLPTKPGVTLNRLCFATSYPLNRWQSSDGSGF